MIGKLFTGAHLIKSVRNALEKEVYMYIIIDRIGYPILAVPDSRLASTVVDALHAKTGSVYYVHRVEVVSDLESLYSNGVSRDAKRGDHDV